MRAEAWIVVDLGFGDAGKGTVTDALTRARGAHTVLRFNGGAQAGHNVVTDDGRHHTFAQFGAGSFVPGVRTHLTADVVVHPTALLAEARHLARAGVDDPLGRVTVSASCKVVTPFQQSATRLRELARGHARHGSCGVGVGEVMRDATTHGEVIRARDLDHPARLLPELLRAQARKRHELDDVLRALRGDPAAEAEREVLESPEVPRRWIDLLAPWRARPLVVDDDHTAAVLRAPGAVVFEGAQGVLLDEWRGFHPYTTWSTCTFDNALGALAGYEGVVRRVGVLRAYATRHGAGPFPTASAALTAALDEPHNPTGDWQGAFRAGHPDLVLARYALAVTGGVDLVALTHLDRARHVTQAAVAYEAVGAGELLADEGRSLRPGPPRDLAWQSRLTELVSGARPVYEPVAGDLAGWFEAALGAPVSLTSWGPRAGDKVVRHSLAP